jgi:AmmeMemoRadiSam system protein A
MTQGRDTPGPADYAFACVRSYVAGGRAPDAPGAELYKRRAACFVTLKKRGELRGCIGTLEPAEASLEHEIARNAQASALRDPRFPPVSGDEIEALTCSVDVLSPSEPCELEDLDPGVFGVIVESGPRRGVLLPALEGIDTVDTQVGVALKKAGIARGDGFDLRRFRVTRYRQSDAAQGPDADAAPDAG